MADSDNNKSEAALIGRLIRSYRNSGKQLIGRVLTQDGLLDLMVERGEYHAVPVDRSSVSHYERGARLAPRDFLEAFGRVLNIPEREVELMLVLAGYESPPADGGREEILAAAQSIESRVETVQRDVQRLMDSTAATVPPADASPVVISALRKAAIPGVYALGVGFVLNAMGLNGTAVLLAYTLVAASIVTGQWVLRWLKSDRDTSEQDHVAGLLFISLFITLNSSVLLGAATKADHFGFYTIETFTDTPMPLVLAMMVNLVLALAGSVIFGLLWNSQHGPNRARNAFSRAILVTLPPILFVYLNIVVFTNFGAWLYFMIVLGVMFGAFAAIVGLNELEEKLTGDGFALKSTVLIIVILCSIGVTGLIIMYLEPDMVMAVAEFRIIPLPEVGHVELGYTAEEGLQRLRMGLMFMSLVTIVYMAIVVGGYLIMTVRRATASPAGENVRTASVLQ